MSLGEVRFAFLAPVDRGDEIEATVGEQAGDVAVSLRKPSIDPAHPSAIEFDPLTGATVGWFVLKILGPAAQAVATALLAEIIKRKLLGRGAEQGQLQIRFPDGEIITLKADEPVKSEEISQIFDRKSSK